MDRYYDRLLPFIRQFLLFPNRNNKFMNLTANCPTPCFNQFCWDLINTTLYSRTYGWRKTRSLNYWSLLTIISHVYCILAIVRLFISLEISFQSSFHIPETYILSYLYAFFQLLPAMYWPQYQLSRFNIILLYIFAVH